MNKKQIEIIFEDKNILIINKISGISVVAENGQQQQDTLLEQVKNYLKQDEIFPVTSIAAGASGIVVFAKNKCAYEFISEQFKKGKVKRTYDILVNGIIEEQSGSIDKPLKIDKENTYVSEKGLKAVTQYEVKEQFKSFAFVQAVPLTSRKNQIRAHFWSLGSPLAFDEVYATCEPVLLSKLKRRYKGIEKEKPLLSRLPLHFSKIEFILPGKHTQDVFESELPQDMEITLKQLRKYNKKG